MRVKKTKQNENKNKKKSSFFFSCLGTFSQQIENDRNICDDHKTNMMEEETTVDQAHTLLTDKKVISLGMKRKRRL